MGASSTGCPARPRATSLPSQRTRTALSLGLATTGWKALTIWGLLLLKSVDFWAEAGCDQVSKRAVAVSRSDQRRTIYGFMGWSQCWLLSCSRDTLAERDMYPALR